MSELICNPRKTMNSLDIADLTDKKHKHVMRDIRTLEKQGAIDESKVGLSSYTDASRRKQQMYLLDFEATMVLITGYDAKLRSKVVTRWVALEKKETDPMAVLNDPNAMRGLLLNYSEKVIALEEEVKEQKPKVSGFNRISEADGLSCVTNAAKTLQMRPKDLFFWLSSNKWIYKRAGGKTWTGYQNRIQQGLLQHKVTTVQQSDGSERVFEQVLVTGKGITRLSKEMNTTGE